MRTDICAVRRAAGVLDEFETMWRARLERFADVLADITIPARTATDHTGAPR